MLLPENYWTDFYDIWTKNGGKIGAYSIKQWVQFIANCDCYERNKIRIFKARHSKTTQPIYLKFSGYM